MMHNHNDKSCHCHNHENTHKDNHSHKACCCHHDELHNATSHEHCHEHHHDTEKNCNCHSEHGHSSNHSCSCNHSDCGCGHEHHEKSKGDLIRYAISLAVFVLSFISQNTYVSAALKIRSVLLCGYKILYYGVTSLIKLKFDENTLMSVAATASAIMGDFNESFLIVLLFSIGEHLEEYAVEKSHKRIEGLIDLNDDVAYDENGKKINSKSIKAGDKILVRPGDKLCVDAEIIEGNTSFDTSNITGESIPLDKSDGDRILAGYINIGNAVLCRATSDYSNSTTAKIKEYVENARNQKANTEKFITKFAKVYTPAVICTAVAMGVILSISGITDISEAIKRALTFMIASCPCALVISIPLSYYAAIGSASKYGILIKGSKHINTLAKADAIAFDKTGTLTDGKIKVTNIEILGNKTKEDLLNYANALEIHSSHPVAKAICNSATITTYKAENVKEHFGKGIEGSINGHKVTLGNKKLVSDVNENDKNGLIMYIDGIPEAVISLSDTLKEDADKTVYKLINSGIQSAYILSGDSNSEVERICSEIGNIKGFGELLPREKADKITELKSKHKAIIYVGDGVNDAPSLSKADFSISIGSGSSLALETGDASLISGSLKSICSVRKISGHTLKVIYTNIVFSLGVKAAVLILAALGMAPVWLALLADVGVLVLAVLNSLSILYKKF